MKWLSSTIAVAELYLSRWTLKPRFRSMFASAALVVIPFSHPLVFIINMRTSHFIFYQRHPHRQGLSPEAESWGHRLGLSPPK